MAQKKFSPRQQAKLASRAIGRQARREDDDFYEGFGGCDSHHNRKGYGYSR